MQQYQALYLETPPELSYGVAYFHKKHDQQSGDFSENIDAGTQFGCFTIKVRDCTCSYTAA